MFNRVTGWFALFFQDGSGVSSSRLVMVCGVIVPLVIWGGLSIAQRVLLDFPAGVLVFIGMCLGLKGTEKVLTTRAAAADKDKEL